MSSKKLACIVCNACNFQGFARSDRSDELLRANIIPDAAPADPGAADTAIPGDAVHTATSGDVGQAPAPPAATPPPPPPKLKSVFSWGVLAGTEK